MRGCILNIISKIVMGPVSYEFHVFKSLRLSKLMVFLPLADLCLDLEIGRDEHPAVKFGSVLLFLSFRPYG